VSKLYFRYHIETRGAVTMNTTTTRRAVMAGAAALPVLGIAATTKALTHDPVVEMGKKLDDMWEEAERLGDILSDTYRALPEELCSPNDIPRIPVCKTTNYLCCDPKTGAITEEEHITYAYTEDQIRKYLSASPKVVQERYIHDLLAQQSDIESKQEAFNGYHSKDGAYMKVCRAAYNLQDKLIETKATTPEGVLVKACIGARYAWDFPTEPPKEDSKGEKAFYNALKDLERMVQGGVHV
jgi:hypothetical protein